MGFKGMTCIYRSSFNRSLSGSFYALTDVKFCLTLGWPSRPIKFLANLEKSQELFNVSFTVVENYILLLVVTRIYQNVIYVKERKN